QMKASGSSAGAQLTSTPAQNVPADHKLILLERVAQVDLGSWGQDSRDRLTHDMLFASAWLRFGSQHGRDFDPDLGQSLCSSLSCRGEATPLTDPRINSK